MHVATLPPGHQMAPLQESEIEEVVEMINLVSIAIIGKPEFTVEEFVADLRVPTVQMERDTVVMRDGHGQVVGYQDVLPLRTPPVRPSVWGYVHPERQGKGIGSVLLAWGEARVRALAAEQVPPELRVAFHAIAVENHPPTVALLEGAGMEAVRHFYRMVRELEEEPAPAHWPEGVVLRPFERERDTRAVFHTIHHAFQDHWGAQPQSETAAFEGWAPHAFGHHYDPSLWFVAWAGDEVVGVARCRASTTEDPAMGWLSQLAVRRPWRRRGLGRALLQHTFHVFFQRGQSRVGLGVDADNTTGALRLYTGAGMEIAYRATTYEKEVRAGIELLKQ